MKKCSKINLRGKIFRFKLLTRQLTKPDRAENLGIIMADGLPWKTRAAERLRKANKVLYLLKRNFIVKEKIFIKLSLYQSLILPVFLYDFHCVLTYRTKLHLYERLQQCVCEGDNWKKD